MNDPLVSTSLRRLRAFLEVCETMHLGRAAERMGIAQPALSEQIRGLETGLGLRLFHRRKRGIELTEAGLVYREDARALLSGHEAAARRARRVARGEEGSLAIGYVASVMFDRHFPDALGALHRHFPEIALDLREAGADATMAALRRGDLDLVAIRGPVTLGDGEVHTVAVTEPLVVMLSATHPLAGSKTLKLAQLREESFITFQDADGAGIQHVVTALAGGELPVRWRVPALSSMLGLCSAALGIGIVPGGLSRLNLPDLRMIPLSDPGAVSELWYVWRSESVSPALQRWLDELHPG